MSAAVIATFNVLELTTTVARGLPFQRAMVPGAKPDPASTSVLAAPPSVIHGGEMELSRRAEIVKSSVFESVAAPVPVAGFWTAIFATPGCAMSAAVMVAVSSVICKLCCVTRGDPFHSTTEVETKPWPTIVSCNPAPPAVAEAGDSDVTKGVGCVPLWPPDPEDELVKELVEPPPPQPTAASQQHAMRMPIALRWTLMVCI